MCYSDDVFDHGIVAMPGGNTGGTQYRAHCVNQHSFDFVPPTSTPILRLFIVFSDISPPLFFIERFA